MSITSHHRSDMPIARRCAAGFTLIELLVVIAILALLAAILLPVFASVRENARKSTCQSNLRQIGLAVQMYTEDWDERLPMWDAAYVTIPSGVDTPDKWWKAAVNSYVKSGFTFSNTPGSQHRPETGVWKCPSSDAWLDAAEWLLLGNGGRPAPRPSTASYGMSMFVAYDFFGPAPAVPWTRYYPGLPLATLRAPANTILVGESGSAGRIGNPMDFHWQFGQQAFNNPQAQDWERRDVHHEGSNYLFCDGHIRWLRAEDAYPEGHGTAVRAAQRYFAATERDYQELLRR